MTRPASRHPAPATALVRALVLSLLTVCALAGVAAVPASAAPTAGGDVTWTVRTAANGYGDDRSSYSYGVNPGGRVEDAMVVANHGRTPLTLAVYAADGFTTPTGQLDLLTRDKKSVHIGAWLSAGHPRVVVGPGKSVEVPFRVSVPANATPGDYVGGVLTSLRQSDDAEGINVDRRLGIRVKLRVSGPLKPALAVEDARVGYGNPSPLLGGGDAKVTYTVHNTGNTVLSAHQGVGITGLFGRLSAHAGKLANTPDLLPGERWKVTVPVHGVRPGLRLTAKVTLTPVLTDASGSTSSLPAVTATAHTWAVPWPLLIVLVVVVAAAVTTLLLVRRGRTRRTAREAARVRAAVEEALRDQKQPTA